MAKRKVKDIVEFGGVKYSCRIYESEDCLDRYTICFARRKDNLGRDVWPFIGCNSEPFHGIGYHGESPVKIDGGHLGKRISFEELPSEVKDFVRRELLN